MTWLLVVFLPAHTRGQMTMGPRDASTNAGEADSCCAPKHATKSGTSDAPTSRDKANCAVCHWAAGLLSTPPFVFDMSHAERALDHAMAFDAQVKRVARRLTHFGRGPPIDRHTGIPPVFAQRSN